MNTITWLSTGACSTGRITIRSSATAPANEIATVRDEGQPVGPAGGDQRPGDVGAEHRHLALGEVEVVGGLVDHHHRERDQGVDAAERDPGQQLLQEQVHRAPGRQ